ncbi:MAG: adenylate/guanylate cyclase domain-containing protein, partial [Nitriliruptorales bacterium]|nr:adenylate/guanylate cyclase domain-containing protein [Nitriliruptorales bacterium]
MSIARPRTRYAESDGARIAYQVIGEGERDVVIIPGFVSHVDLNWDLRPEFRAFLEGTAAFARVVTFDKRGVGLSDRVETAPSIEQRIDDLLAVLDAAEVDRAHLFGISEGAPMAILFAASHPDRVASLMMYGGMARTTEAPDYPFAPPKQALLDSALELITPHWDEPVMLEIMQPSLAEDAEAQDHWTRMNQAAASPAMVAQLYLMAFDFDVRGILDAVHVPTLVMHTRGDRAVPVQAGRYLAEHIPGATFIEYEGIDHVPVAANVPEVVGDIEEFLTGTKTLPEPDRVLATVMFTDIVSSTEQAAAMGDAAWHELLDRHHAAVTEAVANHRGVLRKTLGDGALATFDSPARGIESARVVLAAMEPLGLQVRIGLHCGEVELQGDDVAGIAV